MPENSHSDREKNLRKYESFILGEPLIPAGPIPQGDLLEETKGMVFRFCSSPGTVPERSYLFNNQAQQRMSFQLRFEMAKHNFPGKVNSLFKFLIKINHVFSPK